MKFWSEMSCDYYDSREEAEQASLEFFDDSDLVDFGVLDSVEMIRELRRLGSPLYDEILMNAQNSYLQEVVTECEDEEDY
jgi:hypothetical protein